MSDDERRLVIDEQESPDSGGLIVADDSPRNDFVNMLREMEPNGVLIDGATGKKVDLDLTPPYVEGENMNNRDEAIEDGEIAEDDELTPEEQMKANQQSSYCNSSSLKSPTRISRESRDGREGKEHTSNGSLIDGHSSSRSSGSTTHQYPHSRGAPGGVRSKPDPLSLPPHSHSPAGHTRKSVDHERKRQHSSHSCRDSIHSLHSSISSSAASGAGVHRSQSPLHHPPSLPPMALDVPTTVPSPALTEMIEKGEKREERKREMKENGERRERNGSFSSTCSSHREKEREESVASSASTSNGMTVNGRKRESIVPSRSEEKEGIEPPEKKRKQKDVKKEVEDEEMDEEKEKEMMKKSSSPPTVSRGTSVGVQAEREDTILDLPAGSSITLTFTVVCRSEQTNNDLNNTLYLSTMIGGREMMCVLTDSEILGRRRSLASTSSSDDGNRHGTPSKSFRGGNGTPRDKRARNGMERKRRVQAENDEEDSHDSCGGEGTSGLQQRIELVEKAPKREMHHCPVEGCEFRFPRSSELEYHKEEMHKKKKVMAEEVACQTAVSSFLHRPSTECQTDCVVVMTTEEEKMKTGSLKKNKIEPKEEKVKENGTPALTINTGLGPPLSPVSSTGALFAGPPLLMKASPSSATAAVVNTPSTPTTSAASTSAAGGTETDNKPAIHAPVSAPPPSVSSSSMPTLTPAHSTPSTPSSSSKHPPPSSRHPGGMASVSSPRPLAVPQPSLPPSLPQSLFAGNLQPGSPAHTAMLHSHLMQTGMQHVGNPLQQLSMHPAFASQSQQKAVGGGGGQHKINELKQKQDDAGPSSSGVAPHPHPSVAKVSAAAAAPHTMASPAAVTAAHRQQQQQQQMQAAAFAGFPMMAIPGVAPPTQQQQQMMMAAQQAAAQNQYMQQMMMQHLMNGGARPGGGAMQMQPQMMPNISQEQLMAMMMGMQQQQQQK